MSSARLIHACLACMESLVFVVVTFWPFFAAFAVPIQTSMKWSLLPRLLRYAPISAHFSTQKSSSFMIVLGDRIDALDFSNSRRLDLMIFVKLSVDLLLLVTLENKTTIRLHI